MPCDATFGDVAVGVAPKLDVACCAYMGGATLGLEPKDISLIYNGKRRATDQTLQVAFDEAVEAHGYEFVAYPSAPTYPKIKMVLIATITNRKLPRTFMEQHFSDGAENDVKQCPMCLEDLNGCRNENDNDKSVVLKCGHAMHLACLGRWADASSTSALPTCPMCRAETELHR